MLNVQHLRYGLINTVAIELPARPSATYTVSLYTGTGAAIFEDKTATLSTINATLSSAAAKGATSIAVNVNTGIVAGSIITLDNPTEQALVKTTPASTTVTLTRPLLNAHASASTVEGARLTYSVSAAYSSTLFWDGRLEWTIDTNTVYHQQCICTKYAFSRLASMVDVYDEQANIDDMLPANFDTERALDRALDAVVKRVGVATSGRAYTYTGPHQFVDATVMAFLMQLFRPRSSDSAQRLYERYSTALDAEIGRCLAIVPRDGDQDGNAEADEQRSGRSARILRG